MVFNIQNTRIVKSVRRLLGLGLADGFPTKVGEIVVPTLDVRPSRSPTIVRTTVKTTTGDSTIYTVPTGYKFHLVSAQIAIAISGTCDVATVSLTVATPEPSGSTDPILQLPHTTTASTAVGIVSLSNHFGEEGVICEEGSSIVHTGTFTAGTLERSGTIVGYLLPLWDHD